MYIRDLYIRCNLPPQVVFEKVLKWMVSTGKPTQSKPSKSEENTFYIAQPEKLLLILSESPTEDFDPLSKVHIRIQPYNLPDLQDQKSLLTRFPEKLLSELSRIHSDWKLTLSPLSED